MISSRSRYNTHILFYGTSNSSFYVKCSPLHPHSPSRGLSGYFCPNYEMATGYGRQLSALEQIYDDEYYRLKRTQLPYEIQKQCVSHEDATNGSTIPV